MRSFSVDRDIAAPPEAIWRVLTDVAAWASWNDTVARVDGTVAAGEKVTVHVKAGGRAFPVRVSALTPPGSMVWSGGMPLGLFKGVRTFRLESNGATTRFHMDEKYTGLLAPLIGTSIPDLQPMFDRFADCLKARVERD